MKKVTKILLLAAAICLGLGVILLAIGLNKNGSESAVRLLKNGNFSFAHSGREKHDKRGDNVSLAGNGEENIFDVDFESMEIYIGAAHTILADSTDGKVHVINNSNQKIASYISDNVLEVETEDEINITNPEGTITIMIPAGIVLKEVNMSYGAAEIETEGKLQIDCNSFKIDLGAGEVKLNGISTDKLDINIGAGSVELKNTYSKDLNADLGMGNISYQGDVTGNMELDCNMGNVDMDLDSLKEDHYINFSVSAGNLSIDGEELSGFGSSHTGNTDADSKYDIDLSMGDVKMTFAKML